MRVRGRVEVRTSGRVEVRVMLWGGKAAVERVGGGQAAAGPPARSRPGCRRYPSAAAAPGSKEARRRNPGRATRPTWRWHSPSAPISDAPLPAAPRTGPSLPAGAAPRSALRSVRLPTRGRMRARAAASRAGRLCWGGTRPLRPTESPWAAARPLVVARPCQQPESRAGLEGRPCHLVRVRVGAGVRVGVWAGVEVALGLGLGLGLGFG